MKIIAFTAALLVGSVAAFAPTTTNTISNDALSTTTRLAAGKSQALPFMNKPALVSG
jgi:hypothetical protein